MLQNIIRSEINISPPHSTAMPRRRRRGIMRCCPRFFMSWFLQLTHLHYFIFLQTKSVIEKCICKKNKQVQPTHEAKNHATKKRGELLKHNVAL
jgi:hypothetical protein